MAQIQKVGVAGLGLMGSGIAQVLLTSNYEVWAMEANDELYEKGITRVRAGLNKWAQKQGKTEKDVEQLLEKIHQARKPEDFHLCQAFIEAIIENVEEKKKLFRSLNALAEKMEFIATNTSSIPIAELASAFDVPHRSRFLGMHFFNPVPIMKLIELIPCVETSPQVVEKAKQFGESLGKTTVVSRDVPAFIVNNLLVPYILDAIKLVEQGVATKEDVDKAMKLGTNVPMGPFELLDFVGLDTTLYIADICYNLTKDPRFAAPNLLRQMVALGYTGRKAGRGFYTYTPG
ncbi:MAG: 3-hydroxyacyl-CoA dehydrogenase family protein [bacterium JZ-2024 1]